MQWCWIRLSLVFGGSMNGQFDVVIIGSGFGGAITGCRLAEKGFKVLILERGRRWRPEDYPRRPKDPWIWNYFKPQCHNGWIDLRLFKNVAVAQGAGVGGGSLIYANVSIEAKKEVFDAGWPEEITYSELKPFYDRVGRMLRVSTIPQNQVTRRYKMMKEAAEAIGEGHRFKAVPQAVNFSENWNYDLEDPFNDKWSEAVVNDQGVTQGTCVHCGNCDIGCQVKAKNTLDLNYIPLAEKNGAEVRPNHLVSHISREKDSYTVHFNRIENKRLVAGTVSAKRVVLGAGSLGSTEILLRSKLQYKSLPNISEGLGHRWCSNGDFLTPAFYGKDRNLSPTQGPTISSAIDFLDGSEGSERFFIEDGGFPDALGNYLEALLAKRSWNPVQRLLNPYLAKLVRKRDPLRRVMPWFAQGMDKGGGQLKLSRRWWKPWRRDLNMHWRGAMARDVVNAIVKMHLRLSEATGGKPHVPPTWSRLEYLATPHPLGGCNMGSGIKEAVVDHKGQVFGYPNLFVADGAIVPRSLGLNPSRTIGALAERIAELME